MTPLRGVERLIQSYPHPKVNGRTDPAIVSLVGLELFDRCVTVLAEPGRTHDWRPLAGLYVVLLTRKGVDSGAAVRGILPLAYSLTLHDIDTGMFADVLQIEPKPQVIRWRWK
jgi:hypothetical protein